MTPEDWQLVKTLFNECIALTSSERAARLADESIPHELRSEVLRLLKNLDDAEESFLDPPEFVRSVIPRTGNVLEAGTLLAGRFRIERLIGHGGMGEVYEARDQNLGENVALKILQFSPHASKDSSARFRRELQLARRVTHPSVCRVFDMNRHTFDWGEAEFFTMELLHGVTLSQAIKDRGAFPVADAHPILIQVLEGLQAAHELGIIHRDLKPGNIMLVPRESSSPQSPRAVLMDFGLARIDQDSQTISLTATGDVLGTLPYISPEELTGGEISARTDLYSFGLIWYEMVFGRRPFNAASGIADAIQRLQTPIEMPAEPKIPIGWRTAMLQCLERDPQRRPASAAAVATMVNAPTTSHAQRRRPQWPLSKQVTAAALGVVLLAAASFHPAVRRGVESIFSPVPKIRHVAILPFESQSKEADDIAVSIADSVAARLVRAEPNDRDFWMVSPADLRDKTATTREAVSTAFPVNLVMQTKLTRDTRNFTATMSLLDAKTGKPITSREIVSPVDTLFRLSGLMADEMASMLRTSAPVDPSQLSGTNIAEAYRAYQVGLAAMTTRDIAGIDRAIQQFQLAVELDSKYAAACAALADAYSRKYQRTKLPEFVGMAEKNALRATELDPGLPMAHSSLALVYSLHGKREAAIAELQRAKELDPANANTEEVLGRQYASLGKIREAEAAYRRALALRPTFWNAHNWLGQLYIGQFRYREAEDEYRKIIEILPTQTLAYNSLGGIYAILGDCTRAVPLFQQSIQITPSVTAYSNLADCLSRNSNFYDAAHALEAAVKLDPMQDVAWRNLGDVYQRGLGRPHDAVAAYKKAFSSVESALSINPHDSKGLSGAALYCAKLGARTRAQDYLRSLDKEPKVDVNAQFRAAITEELLQERPNALRRLRDALERGLAPTEVNAAWELSRLRESEDFREMISKSKRGETKQ